MANLIDNTFFVLTCDVPQLGQLYVQEKLTQHIDRYEPEFLNILLGVDFYALFKAGIAVLPNPAQRWLDLKNGVTYQDDEGNSFIWPGLANTTTHISAIACYVFYWYTRSQASWATGSGEILPEVENGNRTNFMQRQYFAWREMVTLNFKFLHFMNAKKDIYPEFKGYGSWPFGVWFFGWNPIFRHHGWDGPYFWPYFCPRPDIFTHLTLNNL